MVYANKNHKKGDRVVITDSDIGVPYGAVKVGDAGIITRVNSMDYVVKIDRTGSTWFVNDLYIKAEEV